MEHYQFNDNFIRRKNIVFCLALINILKLKNTFEIIFKYLVSKNFHSKKLMFHLLNYIQNKAYLLKRMRKR